MAVKKIKQHPDSILLNPAALVSLNIMFTEKGEKLYHVKKNWLDWLMKIVTDLTDTMKEHDGLGLAAPQIGVGMRIIVFEEGDADKFLINPRIVASNNMAKSYSEGCLSVEGQRKDIRRAKNVIVEGYTLINNELTNVIITSKKKMLSFVLQHEIDHINGITILERCK